MKDLKDLFIGMSTRQKTDLRKLMNNNITDMRIYLNAVFKDLKNCLFLFLIILIMVYTKLNKTATGNISFQE